MNTLVNVIDYYKTITTLCPGLEMPNYSIGLFSLMEPAAVFYCDVVAIDGLVGGQACVTQKEIMSCTAFTVDIREL